MPSILVTARIICSSRSARKTLLEAFHKIVEFSQPHEPEVLRYVVALPLDDTTGTVIHMIEEYATQAASDAHMATQLVQDLLKLVTSSGVFAQPPEVRTSVVAANKMGAECPAVSTRPAILLAHYEYKPGALADALKGWVEVVDCAVRDQRWMGGYMVGEEKEKNTVTTVEVQGGWEALGKVHAESNKIVKSGEQTGGNMVGKEVVRVVAVDGFMGREGRARS